MMFDSSAYLSPRQNGFVKIVENYIQAHCLLFELVTDCYCRLILVLIFMPFLAPNIFSLGVNSFIVYECDIISFSLQRWR